MKLFKPVSGCLLMMLGGFFTAFVLQNLWNWFVVPALHASELSYWAAVGIRMTIGLLKGDASIYRGLKEEKLAKMVEACVPPDKLQAIEEEFKSDIWMIYTPVITELGGGALILMFGWVIYTFLLQS